MNKAEFEEAWEHRDEGLGHVDFEQLRSIGARKTDSRWLVPASAFAVVVAYWTDGAAGAAAAAAVISMVYLFSTGKAIREENKELRRELELLKGSARANRFILANLMEAEERRR